jgi:hypothetical protein
MKMSGQLHVPAGLFPENSPRYQLAGGLFGIHSQRLHHFLPLQEIEPRLTSHSTGNTDTTVTELLSLL